ncbi:G5 domain-containing protein [Bifidobacterium sp. ESL0745]|uniref:aggregation-promoting factor C-terminal-like domain-containing protein n=1 Tax=Bifidobacterium sp. ESL0745 TaxID=2983226 RepID=UPI0023F9C5D6|nr:G5 domain-containing protein [Bifidobacterium sp. ESL0745]MDF7666023.1 G5 domain-containing protein [Bifidobacterium sp. ESL0745]
MARRWTPRRFVTLRRIRVAICVAAVLLVSIIFFAITARKTVALTVNGETKTVTTYSASVPRFLESQGVKTKTHDFIDSSNDKAGLVNHDVVTVHSAYQTTINIEGQDVPFWTYATSADQLLGFFKAGDQNAAKVSVNVGNVYNQLTGGFVINKAGPVTVIADGKTSIAPNGKLTAASILDSKNITIGKDDRVSVSEDNGQTILRVQRVTHGQETKNVVLPFSTRTVVDASLQPGQSEVRQAGQNGNKEQIYDVTYVDGQVETSTLKSETVTQVPVDQIVAVGPAAPAPTPAPAPSTGTGTGADSGNSGDDNNGGSSSNNGTGSEANSGSSSSNDSSKDKTDNSNKNQDKDSSKDNSNNLTPSIPAPSTPSQQPSQPTTPSKPAQKPQQPSQPSQPSVPAPAPTPAPTPAPSPTPSGLWHPTPEAAQIYAQGAAAQYGWTGQQWKDLVTLWNKESGWRWNAGSPYAPYAYGIPQSMTYTNYNGIPNYNSMQEYGSDWRDNGATQIAWGLNYIKTHLNYGNPSHTLEIWYSRCPANTPGVGGWY